MTDEEIVIKVKRIRAAALALRAARAADDALMNTYNEAKKAARDVSRKAELEYEAADSDLRWPEPEVDSA